MNEAKITEDQVRAEHMKEVNQAAHWIYLVAVIAVAFVLMIALIAVLGG